MPQPVARNLDAGESSPCIRERPNLEVPASRRNSVATGGDGNREDEETVAAKRSSALPCIQIPYLDYPITTTGNEAAPVGRIRDGKDIVGMSPQRLKKIAGGEIPDFDRIIAAGRGKPISKGRKDHCSRIVGMSFKGPKTFPAAELPELDLGIMATRCDKLPIGSNIHRKDRRFMLTHGPDALAAGKVPCLDSPILTSGDDTPIIG